jgi:hypothetical protein
MTGELAIAMFLIAIGAIHLGWPQVAWRFQNFLWVKGGQPTDFALVMNRLTGVAMVTLGVVGAIQAIRGHG